jgi:hypothetical protein
LKPEAFPETWKTQFEAAVAGNPELLDDPHAAGMFVMSKLIAAYARAVRETGRQEVEMAEGSWR